MPLAFAGAPADPPSSPFEDVEAYESLPQLYDYQQKLHDQVIELIRAPVDANRVFLTLPTGAGKTRTAVEARVTSLTRNILACPIILWIAQSDELCGQALYLPTGVADARYRRGGSSAVSCVGGRDIPTAVEDGVLIASIQSLYQAVRHPEDNDHGLDAWKRVLGAVVIDEAHPHHSTFLHGSS